MNWYKKAEVESIIGDIISFKSSLFAILKRMVGKTPHEIMNKVSYVNLYLGNKYGIGPEYSKEDKALSGFLNSLSYYVYRGLRTKELDRMYHPEDYEDIKREHNYDEFRKRQIEANPKKSEIYDRYFKEKDSEKKNKIMEEMHNNRKENREIQENTEWKIFESKSRKEAERIRKEIENTALTWENLAPDGSKEFQKLQETFGVLKNIHELV